MPKKDGTGPCGEGPKTGRGAGPCLDKDDEKKEDGKFSRKGSIGRKGGMRRNCPSVTEKAEE